MAPPARSSLTPIRSWTAPHFVATVVTSDGRRTQKNANTFHSPQLADKWRREMVSKLPAAQRPSVQAQIRIFPNRVQAEAYARQWLAN